MRVIAAWTQYYPRYKRHDAYKVCRVCGAKEKIDG